MEVWVVTLSLLLIGHLPAASTFSSRPSFQQFQSNDENNEVATDGFPYQVKVMKKENQPKKNSFWDQEAATFLRQKGVVALTSAGTLINEDVCDRANEAATSRLLCLKEKIRNRGIDSSGADGPYRFLEVACRDEGGRRFDLPVPAFAGSSDLNMGTPMTSQQTSAIKTLHSDVHQAVQPVLTQLWNDEPNHVLACGFLANEPGSYDQTWHRDGPDEGYVNIFLPLISLTPTLGPTEVQPQTHDSSARVDLKISPLIEKGQILMMDYRTLHRGLGNLSKNTTRTVAYMVYRRGASESSLGDIRNFPNALTLEYD